MNQRIEALDTFYGTAVEGIVKPGQQWETTESRAQELFKRGLVKLVPAKAAKHPEDAPASPPAKHHKDAEQRGTKPAKGPTETK